MESEFISLVKLHTDNDSGIRELARKTGLASSTVCRIANGKVSPNINTCEKILKALGYEIRIERTRGILKDGKKD